MPAVRATAPDGRSFAVDLVPGSPSRGAEALDDYLAVLGRLHAAGSGTLPAALPGFDAVGRDDLEVWEQVAGTRLRRPAPLVDEAFAALRRHGAFEPPEVVACHGDAGQGNYLQADGVVTGLVDWELAYTGAEDLAELPCYRTFWHLPIPDDAQPLDNALPSGLSVTTERPLHAYRPRGDHDSWSPAVLRAFRRRTSEAGGDDGA